MRHLTLSSLAATIALAVAATGSAAASDLSYTYLRAGAVGVDVDESGNVENPKKNLVGEVTTDNETGFYLGGSWAVFNRWLVFAEYQEGGQDATLRGTGDDGLGNTVDVNRDGDFDLIRLRVGVGYVLPMGERWDLIGKLSFDYSEMDSVGFPSQPAVPPDPTTTPPFLGRPGVPGIPGDDEDDYGFGVELGARAALWKRLDGEAWVRYTSVGELGIEDDYSGEFDDDFLGGVRLHWAIGNKLGVEAGYEYGEITTWSVGARFEL